jgi:hypothetical protein
MKPTVTTLVCVLAAGLASAQSPSVIQNTRSTMNGVSNNSTAASNEALGIRQSPPTSAKTTHASASSSGVAVVSVKPALAKNHGSAKRKTVAKHSAIVAVPKPGDSAAAATTPDPTAPDTKYSSNGKRDPFISPVVSHAGGSGCSTGKKCLDIGEINLRGVVHSDGGFIAVVSNGLNKAYFLRENDPVFNGYVMKITGDSVVFQQTLQDRLGKTFTREVVKKITTPAV